VHKCSALGIGKDVLYHEMIEGGHAGAADNAARAAVKTLENRFLIDNASTRDAIGGVRRREGRRRRGVAGDEKKTNPSFFDARARRTNE
jgi:hypothetical protein